MLHWLGDTVKFTIDREVLGVGREDFYTKMIIKDDLIQMLKDSFYHNTHVTEEGRQLHRQEHFHLLKLIEKCLLMKLILIILLTKKKKYNII